MEPVLNPDLLAVVEPVVEEARVLIAKRIEDGGYMPTISDWPSLGQFDSGFPSVSHLGFTSKEPDYQHLFSLEGRDYGAIGYRELPSLLPLFDFVRSRPDLAVRITMTGADHGGDDRKRRWFEIGVALFPLNLVDRLVHLHGPAFTRDQMLDVYGELERGALLDSLPVELWVPLALTPIDRGIANFDLCDGVSIRQMSDQLQCARVPPRVYGGTVNELILQAATHAIVIGNFLLPNENRWIFPTHAPWFYPLDRVDTVIQALRIGTEVATGYAQLFLRPLGWAHDYTGDLPPVLHGAMIRRYPPSFDDGGWRVKPTTTLDVEGLSVASRTYAQLLAASDRLKLASRRLSGAALREDETDAILDLCIGLEAALGDDSRNDITFKLALRVAAVLGTQIHDLPPSDYFDQTRKIYKFRSAAVHGGEPDRYRVVRDSKGRERLAVEVAAYVLRSCVRALLAEPRTPAQIDRDLVLRSLSSPQPLGEPPPLGVPQETSGDPGLGLSQ